MGSVVGSILYWINGLTEDEGCAVGRAVGIAVGRAVGIAVGRPVGFEVGILVGVAVTTILIRLPSYSEM